MYKRIIIFLICIITISGVKAVSRFSYYGNNFKTIAWNDVSNKNKDINLFTKENSLYITNESTLDYILADTTSLPHNYRYTISLSNTHNKPGKSYKVANNKSVAETHWGMALDASSNGDMLLVDVYCNNSNLHDDIRDKRSMHISLFSIVNNKRKLLISKTIYRDIDLYEGENTFTANLNDNNITILLGKKDKIKLLETTVVRKTAKYNSVGIYVGSGTELKINRTMANYATDNRFICQSQWTIEALKQHFLESHNPLEGFYNFLDRETEDKWMRLGGRYTIAIVENREGKYEIIYCDGAQVNKSQWAEGMVKGTITSTMFSNIYNGTWIDATFEPIIDDVQISLENAVILTIKFPIYKSQIRFSKIIDIL